MSITLAVAAIKKGFSLCLGDRRVRSLAVKPWLLGVLCYLLAMLGVYYSHGPVVHRFITSPEGFWHALLYWIIWLAAAVLLTIFAVAASFVIVMAASGIFHTKIAEYILSEREKVITPAMLQQRGIASEALRTVRSESIKLFWIIPLLLLLFILGFIPLLTPVVFLVTAWLLAYQAIDFGLDVLYYKVGERLVFGLRGSGTLTIFGVCLALIALVPFALIVLPPIAVAGGTWLIVQLGAGCRQGSQQVV